MEKGLKRLKKLEVEEIIPADGCRWYRDEKREWEDMKDDPD